MRRNASAANIGFVGLSVYLNTAAAGELTYVPADPAAAVPALSWPLLALVGGALAFIAWRFFNKPVGARLLLLVLVCGTPAALSGLNATMIPSAQANGSPMDLKTLEVPFGGKVGEIVTGDTEVRNGTAVRQRISDINPANTGSGAVGGFLPCAVGTVLEPGASCYVRQPSFGGAVTPFT